MKKILACLRHKDKLSFEGDNLNYHIIETNNSLEGLLLIKDINPDIIILDYATSRLNGLDCLEIIRSNPKNHHIKIIFATSSFNYSFFRKAFDMGADYFIHYPINKKDIEEIVSICKLEDNFFDLEKLSSSIEACKLEQL